MAQTKSNCANRNCRRLIGLDTPVCPFCNTPNPKYNPPTQSSGAKHKPTAPDLEEQTSGGPADPSPSPEDQEVSIDDLETLYRNPIPVQGPTTPPSGQSATQKEQHESQDLPEEDPEQLIPSQDRNTISSVQETNRSRIDWEDEKKESVEHFTEMFNDQGIYQANYDGYYNDTLPKLQGEADRALADRGKAIMKAIFTFIGIIAIIVYLVLTN